MAEVRSAPAHASDYEAAREGLGHRVRRTGVLDVEGEDRVAFLQGQLTQDVRALAPGEARPAAALTPTGKLLFLARVVGFPNRIRLLVPADSREPALAHLRKFVIFQKVAIADRSNEFARVGLYGGLAAGIAFPESSMRLPADGEFSAEVLVPAAGLEDLERLLARLRSVPVGAETAEILRVEAGRPRFGQDADSRNLADEVGLEAAISTTKGCYVGQEIVARLRTYGRVNRRLVGFRFPRGLVERGSLLKLPEEAEPGKIEQGRVTSAVVSPRMGPIGLGYAFREVPAGARLVCAADPSREAIVASLPFSS
jgi:folate-binding protein YgfZ